MTMDTALNHVLNKINTIMIPASESRKIEEIKGDIVTMINVVRNDRAKREAEQREAEQAAAQRAAVKEDNHDEN